MWHFGPARRYSTVAPALTSRDSRTAPRRGLGGRRRAHRHRARSEEDNTGSGRHASCDLILKCWQTCVDRLLQGLLHHWVEYRVRASPSNSLQSARWSGDRFVRRTKHGSRRCPIVRPFHATSVGRTTSMNSEWIVLDPAFQSKGSQPPPDRPSTRTSHRASTLASFEHRSACRRSSRRRSRFRSPQRHSRAHSDQHS